MKEVNFLAQSSAEHTTFVLQFMWSKLTSLKVNDK